ncbi:hypothetical protein H6802_02915 [Candidatus Nomurabacteria bacterium]|uniref:Uncharacterized protein n=1 Tax=candidate division WWE3 bacterium TaxID=2053526 RepID=A0A955E175_UNCKA|nr:hypothetical protein [candidate division WWE3 bacterium]MCB9823885.1 hypothetical protein [Candidatus Nomurabacteria bacterium]MCB9827135.1 hypothetical protein [Candidatus Nomurabacteria bacterium]MCB9827824.1 hypothetical protein [Candidatus Nomurabacteria bacterium]
MADDIRKDNLDDVVQLQNKKATDGQRNQQKHPSQEKPANESNKPATTITRNNNETITLGQGVTLKKQLEPKAYLLVGQCCTRTI